MLWKPDKWVCVSKRCEIWNHTHSNILALKKTKTQNHTHNLAKKMILYLNSHSTFDLVTSNFKLSSVASNCEFLFSHNGEDNEDGGKLDLHLYLGSQFSNLCWNHCFFAWANSLGKDNELLHCLYSLVLWPNVYFTFEVSKPYFGYI